MKRPLFALLTLALAVVLTAPLQADLTSYAQDFETFGTAESGTDPTGLGDDGWLGFASNWTGTPGDRSSGAPVFSYGTFPAPNGGPGFSGIEDNLSQGNPDTDPQGARHLNIYSDYNEGLAHGGTTNWLDALVFRDNSIGAIDVGSTWTFSFDHKANSEIDGNTGNPFGPGGLTNTFAFVKVLQSSNGSFATLAEFDIETTNTDLNDWSNDSIDITIDGAWAGELLQFGFRSEAQNFDPSGVLYDNLSFTQAVPEPGSLGLIGVGLIGIVFRRRRQA